jgi:(2R)-ethylmalonyl-CoA mutase
VEVGFDVMPASIQCARVGVTTGEWADTLRAVYGDYRAPTGIESAYTVRDDEDVQILRQRVDDVSEALGRRLRILIGKPGLDGHSNGAEQLAIAARNAGMEVVYQGIRLTPEQIIVAAIQEDVHLVGLSILSGSHGSVVPPIVEALEVPVMVGGIIPESDAAELRGLGVVAVHTPGESTLDEILAEMVEVVARTNGVG